MAMYDLKIAENEMKMEKMLQEKQRKVMICKDHPLKEIEFYDAKNKSLLCSMCYFEQGI